MLVNWFRLIFGLVNIQVSTVLSVGLADSNLHVLEGVSVADIIGGDVFFEIIEPEVLRYTYRTRPAKDFGIPMTDASYVSDVALVPLDPFDGCTWPSNAKQVMGNIAFVQRGDCSFLSKAVMAEKVGARAVVIADNDITNDEITLEMVEDTTGRNPNIPAVFLHGKNGYIIKMTLQQLGLEYAVIKIPVNLTRVALHKMNQPPWFVW